MEGLRILESTVENFKNIGMFSVNANGKSFIIVGKNGAGKSSLIQALLSPMDNRLVGDHVIQEGKEKARIKTKIGGMVDGESIEYTIEATFNESRKKGLIKVFDKDGNKVKQHDKFLKGLIGDVSFDVFEFIRKGRTSSGKVSESGVLDQINTIKSILPKDVQKKMAEIDAKYKEVYSERSLINAQVKAAESYMNNSNFTQEEINKYMKEPEDISALIEKQQKFTKDINSKKEIENGIASRKESISKNISYIQRNNEQIEKYKKMIQDLESENKNLAESNEKIQVEITKGNEWLSKFVEPNIKEVNDALKDANDYRVMHSKISEFILKHKEKEELMKKSATLTRSLKEIEEEKLAIQKNVDSIVSGLSFDDTQIFYNGKPFNELSQPKSVIIGVGVKIAMALNPMLRVLTIADGSLLDEESMKTLVGMADKYGYQLIIEVVGTSDLDIEFTEDKLK